MGEDKPELTDPSAQAAQTAIDSGSSNEQLVAERVAEAIKSQQAPVSTPAQETTVASSTDGGSKSDVQSGKVSSSVDPDQGVLKLIGDTVGRTFASREEAQKFLTNLNSLVGDQAVAKTREEAKAYEALVTRFAGESGKSVEEVKRFFADELIKGSQQKPETKVVVDDTKIDKVSSEVEQLRAELQKQQLLSKYPAASEIQEEISILARQKGVSQLEAFEASPFKSYIETKVKEESAKSPVVTSSSKVSPDLNKVKDAVAKVKSLGREEDMINLVKQFGDRVGLNQ